MPELPEVEHVRRGLRARLIGAVVVDATLIRADMLRFSAFAPAPDPLGRLRGTELREVHRHGKFLALEFTRGSDEGPRRGRGIEPEETSAAVLGLHLGMAGRIILAAPASRPLPHAHAQVRFELGEGGSTATELRFHDPRRFGGLWMNRTLDEHRRQAWCALGPDALESDPAELAAHMAQSLRRTRRTIKAVLLDQRVIAGIGNIYADEILHRSGIDPRSIARRLPTRSVGSLLRAAREILASAVEAGGSTIRDHIGVDGIAGTYRTQHAVYGQAGAPCPRCGSTIRQASIAGRTTAFCPFCQSRGGTRRLSRSQSARVVQAPDSPTRAP
ncbi:MAG TPA: bifunctional DNA-formamidopyrimidine glycosylase/DNA-(apurinic or apyrimidinic site) lyase [Phycisphaerales bacterium]|nr:bifunctional DNA-formamidopyrimidine glycosylase/DNA-(apurinic or apyrimidinic site) lyase [Phycisphaerales bacterium]HMP36048.1 bifunctional DNA-formamidopyrimidine glycosylase/DNA-(apurinic or apyrimidinic site) lyase [Phycisphaerales bacterium]